MTKYTVLFYPNAQEDLEEIREYVEKALSISASSFLEKLLAHIQLLEDNPYIHAQVRDPILKEKTIRVSIVIIPIAKRPELAVASAISMSKLRQGQIASPAWRTHHPAPLC